ncbi:hypothetical protein [Nocardia iowensis]|uniref:Uncharacterized protein n=1 Tax=Nocardia iowensis TaxID=204891 RepID=A0ABX8RXQ0_NOCIO|nr:hypothetical protein [Nocardia iowensis]QXN94450.1 hypothetical protein KV110_16160 [Nocardia iowensis]
MGYQSNPTLIDAAMPGDRRAKAVAAQKHPVVPISVCRAEDRCVAVIIGTAIRNCPVPVHRRISSANTEL